MFIATTCLDFVPLFQEDRRAAMMCQELIRLHQFYDASLHAIVVMPEHLHWIARLPEGRDVSYLVNRIKASTRYWLVPDLTESEQLRLLARNGLGRRRIWERSFRSYICVSAELVRQKVKYIHENPVRRNLVESPSDYDWSTARVFAEGDWSDDFEAPLTVDMFS